ncbi:MAG TPA: dihydrofolate reductase family protein [Erysipelotrichaceae bacterium]|nr:dihydrofolate reductase family protein [Erysipelotrichaceae bacterium]
MRKIIVSNMITLDGFYEGKDHSLDSLFEFFHPDYHKDESMDKYNLDLLIASDFLLFSGKESFLGFKSFWQNYYSQPNTSEVRIQISKRMNLINKIVVSDKIETTDLGEWQNTEIIRISELEIKLAEIKNQVGKNLLILGGRTLWNSLMDYELIDELHIMIFPLLAYEGVPLLTSKKKVYLKLIDTQTWKGSGNVIVRYTVLYKKDIKQKSKIKTL